MGAEQQQECPSSAQDKTAKHPAADATTRALIRDIDEVCDRFEAAWRAGSPPDIAEYLTQISPPSRAWLLCELIRLDVHYRGLRGDDFTMQDYRDRFPEFAVDLHLSGTMAMSDCRLAPPSEPSLLPSRAQQLAETWPFSQLPLAVVHEMADQMTPCEFAPGEVIVRQGEPSRQLIVILEGHVDVRLRANGVEQSLVQTPNTYVLGEMGLLTSGHSTATVVAETHVRAMVLPVEQFQPLAQRHPVLRAALSQLLAKRLGQYEADAFAGKVVSDYQIRRCVGRGGMGVVYEAESLSLGRRVALKMMSHQFSDNPQAQARFQREMQLNQRLRHPGLLAVYDSFAAMGTNFIAMEFCDGPTFSELLRKTGPVSDENLRPLIGQLATVLAYLHGELVCHRDLKPANVMLNSQGQVKLTDFGLAWSNTCTELTGQQEILGTPRYMAPEQLEGGRVHFRADLFSFGLIVWELVAGGPLFTGGSTLSIMRQHADWELPRPDAIRPGLAPEIYKLLRETLSQEPARRTVDLAEVAAWNCDVGPDLLAVARQSRTKDAQPASGGDRPRYPR